MIVISGGRSTSAVTAVDPGPMLDWIRPLIRRIFPNLPIDLSAIVVFFLLNLAQRLLYRLYVLLAF